MTRDRSERTVAIPQRYVTDSGDVRTAVSRVRLDFESETASVNLSLPGVSASVFELSRRVDPFRDRSYLPELTTDELRRRLPEIRLIDDERLRERVAEILIEECPDHYWRYPSSTSGRFHPIDERGVHGQWIHTKRVVATFDHLADSPRKAARDDASDGRFGISDEEYRCGLVATLLHDVFKFGTDDEQVERTLGDHDARAAQYLEANYDLPPGVIGCIDAHNGPWKDGKQPETQLELLVHYADMMVADSRSESLLLEPTPEIRLARILAELRAEQFDDVRTVELRQVGESPISGSDR